MFRSVVVFEKTNFCKKQKFSKASHKNLTWEFVGRTVPDMINPWTLFLHQMTRIEAEFAFILSQAMKWFSNSVRQIIKLVKRNVQIWSPMLIETVNYGCQQFKRRKLLINDQSNIFELHQSTGWFCEPGNNILISCAASKDHGVVGTTEHRRIEARHLLLTTCFY